MVEALKDKMKYLRNHKPRSMKVKRERELPDESEQPPKKPRKELTTRV